MMRRYPEQRKIANFDALNSSQRRNQVEQFRKADLLRLQKSGNHKQYKQAKKNYKETDAYTHLTFEERKRSSCRCSRHPLRDPRRRCGEAISRLPPFPARDLRLPVLTLPLAKPGRTHPDRCRLERSAGRRAVAL